MLVDVEKTPIVLERDLRVPMRDGVTLLANLFRPRSDEPHAVIISVTPYGKDKLQDRLTMFFMRLSGVRFGRLHYSRLTGFESPDPAWWVREGYAVLQADVRGMHKSEGRAGVLRIQDAEDYFDLIEWAALQAWCTGRVGLIGVSYLAMSQWRVAALRPPHLRAMVPWEGVTDLYREFAFHGGIPETKFVPTWFNVRIRRGRNRKFPLAEDFLQEREHHPLDDEYWAGKRAALEDIEAPALVCASWSDHGLHSRGSIEAFERISSRQKWLFTHGRKKWETFYSDEALAWQKRFLDHFLRGVDNGQERVPQVRLEVRKAYYRQAVRYEETWPLASIQPTRLYLDAGAGAMQQMPVPSIANVRYRATRRRSKASFSFRFDHATELIGGMRLKLWISTSEGDDLDLFIVIRKLDGTNRKSCFPVTTDTNAMPWPKDGCEPHIGNWTSFAALRFDHGIRITESAICVLTRLRRWRSRSGRRPRSSRRVLFCRSSFTAAMPQPTRPSAIGSPSIAAGTRFSRVGTTIRI